MPGFIHIDVGQKATIVRAATECPDEAYGRHTDTNTRKKVTLSYDADKVLES